MIQLIIADNDEKVRSAIRLLLEQELSCWQVVSEVRNADDLLRSVSASQPQILLLDSELPQTSRTFNQPEVCHFDQYIKQIKQNNPQLRVIVLSSIPHTRSQVLACGADEFVSKTEPPEVLLDAMYTICNLERPVSLS